MLIKKNLANSVFLSALGNMDLIVSLKAKLNAWVGKYRIILVMFPRQNALTPCSEDTREKQSTIPV